MKKDNLRDVNEELYEHFKIEVDKGQDPLRIDKFIINRIENTSRNRIQLAAKNGFIFVNNKTVKSNYKVKPFDEIKIMLAFPKRELELTGENIALDVIYEDEHILIVNKPYDMVVHPGHGNYSGTMLNGLIYHFEKQKINDINPGLVHRIDKNTTGLLVVAKSDESLIFLTKQFYDRTVDRSYFALVWGDLKNDSGRIEGNIGRNLKNRKLMDVFPDGDYGKHAVTNYKVIQRFGYVTLVECKLETGRTHQIRAHFKYIKHPLFNDSQYGGDKILKGTIFNKYKQFIQNCFKIMPRQSLHAASLGFIHPGTNKKVNFNSPMPDDFKSLLKKWAKYIEVI